MYYDVIEPFVALASAAAVDAHAASSRRASAWCVQRDPIQTAKSVATPRPRLERPLPVRDRRGLERRGDGEPRHATSRSAAALMRERVEAMKEIWTRSKAEYHGKLVDFDPIMAWPKPVQKPHPPIHVGGGWPARGAARHRLRRRLDADPRLRRPRREAPRVPQARRRRRPRPGGARDHDLRPAGQSACDRAATATRASRAACSACRPPGATEVLPLLDRYAELLSAV